MIFLLFYLLLNTHHQNKTNRMCIKHRKLQCFLSMSLNLFSTTLGYVIFLPPSKGGPGGGGYHLYPYKFTQLLSAEVFPALQAWQEVGRGSLWTGSFNHKARNKPHHSFAQKNPSCSRKLWVIVFVVKLLYYNMQHRCLQWMVIWWKMCIFFWLPDQNGLWGNVCREDHGCAFLFRCVLALERSSSDHINCNPTRGKQQFIDNFVTSKWYFTQSQVNLPPLLRYWPPRQKVVVIKGSLTLMRPC